MNQDPDALVAMLIAVTETGRMRWKRVDDGFRCDGSDIELGSVRFDLTRSGRGFTLAIDGAPLVEQTSGWFRRCRLDQLFRAVDQHAPRPIVLDARKVGGRIVVDPSQREAFEQVVAAQRRIPPRNGDWAAGRTFKFVEDPPGLVPDSARPEDAEEAPRVEVANLLGFYWVIGVDARGRPPVAGVMHYGYRVMVCDTEIGVGVRAVVSQERFVDDMIGFQDGDHRVNHGPMPPGQTYDEFRIQACEILLGALCE